MKTTVYAFDELTTHNASDAGGKARVLAQLWQDGFPVPDGFVILPGSFQDDSLTDRTWSAVTEQLSRLRHRHGADCRFAVRSSAVQEDSRDASFGGQFDTVLDVRSDGEIRAAIQTVRGSRRNARVHSYSEAKGMAGEHEIAVIVQLLVAAEVSGVLFTADPVTGSRTHMIGNCVHGLGEQLVSGDVSADSFSLERPRGSYSGPDYLRKQASRLYRYACRLEALYEVPQDIEWGLADNTLYILQSRPITTLQEHDPRSMDWNSSRTGDYLWVQMDVYPEVFTPSSWSLWQLIFHRKMAGTSVGGNIGGRVYMNYSLTYAILRTFGRSHQDSVDYLMVTLGIPPDGVTIPEIPLTLRQILAHTSLSEFIDEARRRKSAGRFLAAAPGRCRALQEQVGKTDTNQALADLWTEAVKPFFWDCFLTQSATNEEYINPYVKLKQRLAAMIGDEQAMSFIASIGGGSEDLSSVKFASDLGRVARGELSRTDYLRRYGHRHPNENELAVPRPYEHPGYLDRQLEAVQQDPGTMQDRIQDRAEAFETVLERLAQDHPRWRMRKLHKLLDQISAATRMREAFRSELTRAVGLVRAWYLRAAELTGLDDRIFFLTFEEVLALLGGEREALQHIPARQHVYEAYRALPPYPGWIRGQFDPFQWAKDPTRRMDLYDASRPAAAEPEGETLQGFAGSAGRVEGIVRVLHNPADGDQLASGEILVAVTTNIGWTPLFPRARAVVTDVGAPLAHAAIVARELGIPAVVGCGNATLRLHTGDRIRVDGTLGVVDILERVGA